MKLPIPFFKALFLALTVGILITSCTDPYDDSAIQTRLDNHETRISDLEKACSQMNANISALSQVINALKNNDFITSVEPIMENGETVGYVLNFSKSGAATIYHGKNASAPQFGVAQDGDGLWYWTLNGNWLANTDGEMVLAVGTAPKMKIEENYWYASYDGGATWKQLGRATGADGDSMFNGVIQDDRNVYLTLANGTIITLPKELQLSISFEADNLVVMNPNESRDIRYSITSSYDSLSIEIMPSVDLRARVISDSDPHTGILHVETQDSICENTQVLLFVSDGHRLVMRAIHFEQQTLAVSNAVQYWVSSDASEITLHFLSNVDCQVIIPSESREWIGEPRAKAITERRLNLSIAQNNGAERSSKVWVATSDGKLKVEYVIHQYPDPQVLQAELQHEREVLEKWFRECDGKNWSKHNNWCSGKPLNEWEGVVTYYGGHVLKISLPNNKMDGKLPEEIWGFRHLGHLYIPGNNLEIRIPDDPDKLTSSLIDVTIGNYSNAVGRNHLVGGLPHAMAKFENLVSFYAPCMEITGTIPDELWSLPNLTYLGLEFNHLEGALSPAIANAKKLQILNIQNNRLVGPIPEEFGEMESLCEALLGNNSGLSGFDFPLECNHFTRLPESLRKLNSLNTLWIQATGLEGQLPDGFYDCEVLGNILLGTCRTTAGYENRLGEFSERFGEMKFLYCLWGDNAGFTGKIPSSLGKAQYVEQILLWNNDLTGNLPEELADATKLTTFQVQRNRLSGEVPERIMNCEQASGWILNPQQESYGLTFSLYESTDYSRDGNAVVLQRATKGRGIDLVLLGDAFCDTDLADGTYERTMRNVADNFFAVEPYSSFRDYFNVYMVEAVSANNRYAPGAKRALNTRFGSGTTISGSDAKCFDYAQKAIGEERMDEVLVIVTLNRKNYAGTCYMYHPDEGQGDYGNGPSIAYFPLGTDADMFRGLVQHEAGGHGFAKLDDEYDYGNGVGQSFIESRTKMFDWGWWPNIDFTNDPDSVKWARFLHDGRYANENLGIFEGGATYGKGVWRPSENSIMRYNTGIFNAPSREAIYTRINKLAYGDDWQYDYEQFVAWDAVNRVATKASWNNWKKYAPLEKPVVTGKSWREASDSPVVEEDVPRNRFSANTKETAEVVKAYAGNACVTMNAGVLTTTTTAPKEITPTR